MKYVIIGIFVAFPLATNAQYKLYFDSGINYEVNIVKLELNKVFFFFKNDTSKVARVLYIDKLAKISLNGNKYSSKQYKSYWDLIRKTYADLVDVPEVLEAREIEFKKQDPVINEPNILSRVEDSILDLREYEYCELLFIDYGIFNWNNNRNTIRMRVDIGQKGIPQPLKDKNGNELKFFSNMEGLTYMGKLGWEFVQAYSVSIPNQGSVYHYIMKRKLH